MDVKEYIESGVLELFVLGQLDPREREDVLIMASRHPEVRAELENVQQAIEQMSLQQGIEPRTELKSLIESRLAFTPHHEAMPATDLQHNGANVEGLVAAQQKSTSVLPIKFYIYTLAACLTLLIISAVCLYSLWNQLKETQRDYDELLVRSRQYSSQVVSLQEELGKSRTVMNDPYFRKLALAGTKSFPSSNAVVWWNHKTRVVMIDPSGLSRNDGTHSYQLWAILDGKPVDAGVFDVKGELSSVTRLKDISHAQAFAITLEKKGGSESPTLSAMVAIANI